MSTAVSRPRRARGSLSEQEILDAAIALVESDGLRQLSLPTLAKHLGCGVASIYGYFHSKDDLLDGLAQRVLSAMHTQLPPVGDGAWDDELVRYFEAFHDLLQEQPAYREVVAYGSAFIGHSLLTRGAQRRLEDGLALLRRAGLSTREARTAFGACLNYTRGFVALQQGLADRAAGTKGRARTDDLGDFNRVDDESFRHGLRLLVAGIASRVSP
ncbi:MAG TPA: TetR/AcrR family transcriptional regulator [Mycobacteriales bacterium]|nr:TetR/AcrR family transcriptional regulator [Mycobacteriales bacterium]